MAARFFLCDPSIEGRGGHYLTYAERVLSAAAAVGLEPVLVANRAFQPAELLPWPVRTPFEFNCWRQRTLLPAPPGLAFSADDRRFLRLKYSELGLYWVNAGRLADFRLYNEAFPLPMRLHRRFQEVLRVRRLTEALAASRPATDEAGDPPATETERRARGYRRLRAGIVEAMRLGRGDGAGQLWNMPPDGREAIDRRVSEALNEAAVAADAFADALQRLSREFPLTGEDHLFFPNMTGFEMSGLRTAILNDPTCRAANYHLLFRRNAYDGCSDTFDAQEWQVHPLRLGFALLAEVTGALKIRCYTDTEELTRQYNRFDTFDFATLAIPVEGRGQGAAVTLARHQAGQLRNGPESPTPRLGTVTARPHEGERSAPGLAAPPRNAWHIVILALGIRPGWVDALEALLAQPRRVGRKPAMFEVFSREPLNLGARAALSHLSARYPDTVQVTVDPELSRADQALREAHIAVAVGEPQKQHLAAHPLLPAVAAGTPILVGHDSALAGVLAQAAPAYHAQAIGDERVFADLGGAPADYAWREYHASGEDRANPRACDQAGLKINSNPTMYLWLPVAPEASYVWVSFDCPKWRLPADGEAVPATAVVLSFQSGGNRRRVLSESEIVLPGRTVGNDSGRRSLVAAVPAGASQLWLGLRSVGGKEGDRIAYFQVRWLRGSGKLTTLAGGASYFDGPDREQTVRRLSDAVRGLLADHPAYRRGVGSAQQIGRELLALPTGSTMTATTSNLRAPSLVITYLGDARRKKGFHRLPEVEEAVSARYGGSVRLVLQCYLTAGSLDIDR